MVQGEKYYWYGEHKTEGKAGNLANVGVHCYSSTDLINWRDEGIVLEVSDDPQSEIAKGCILERPKVIYNKKNNNYVMWFHLELKDQGYGAARSGIATATSPTGPFTYQGSVRPNREQWPINLSHELKTDNQQPDTTRYSGGSLPDDMPPTRILSRDFRKGQMARDMTLFVDDDNKAYHIYSSEENSTLHIALLNEDYTAHTGIYTRIFEGRFMEAPAITKHENRYYLIMSGCTGWAPNAARSAVADNILGEWTELGNPCLGEGSETTFNSQGTFIQRDMKNGNLIFMADRWNPQNAIDGRYIWLPLTFENGKPVIRWIENWLPGKQ
jgi:beta-xylosidase